MPQSFSLSLHNPALTSLPDDVIYTGLGAGNVVNLVLANNSGFDLAFAAGPGAPLLISISSEMLDKAGADAITVDAPWRIDGLDYPADPAPAGGPAYYRLKLLPAAAQPIGFPDGGSLTITLRAIKPGTTGTGAFVASYPFDDLPMSPAAQVTVLASGTAGKTLIGEYLDYSRRVNSGDELNPIVATEPTEEVTADNAAENQIHLSFFLLNPEKQPGGSTMGQLVPAWDAAHPPTFKLRFPYFNAISPDPARADLTDDYPVGDKSYNEFTSAWNIRLSLDTSNPAVLENDWWKITPPAAGAPSPYWLIQPKPANTHLFTGIYTGPNSSGPFLDLFFSHIYSNLPFSPNSPHTQIILETLQFPGFNDAILPQPLNKVKGVEILSFGGRLEYSQRDGMVITLNWKTRNADYCTITGNASKLNPSEEEDGYRFAVTSVNPLKSALTLTAYYGKEGMKIRRTLNVRWKADNTPVFAVSPALQLPTALCLSPTDNTVYVVGEAGQTQIGSVSMFDARTMIPAGNPVQLPDKASVTNAAVSPDGARLLLAGRSFDGNSGMLYACKTGPVALLPVPPVPLPVTLLPNLYDLAVSDDSSQVLVGAPYAAPPAGLVGGFGTLSLAPLPAAGNPRPIDSMGGPGLATRGDKLFHTVSGASKGLGVLTRTTLQPVTGSPISLRANAQGIDYSAGPMVVSRDGKTVMTLASGFDADFTHKLFILCQVDVPTMRLVRRVEVFNGYGNGGASALASLLYSVDEKYLFICGQDFASEAKSGSRVSVFDAQTLQELPWSPIQTPLSVMGSQPGGYQTFVVDMKISPDGCRIFALTLNSPESTFANGSVRSFMPYFH